MNGSSNDQPQSTVPAAAAPNSTNLPAEPAMATVAVIAPTDHGRLEVGNGLVADPLSDAPERPGLPPPSLNPSMADLPEIDYAAIEAYCQIPEKDRVQHWSEDFLTLLTFTSETGKLACSWDWYREIIKGRLLLIVTSENDRATTEGRALDVEGINRQLHVIGRHFRSLTEAPFTIQRVCELVLFPGNGQHKTLEKYLRAIEKVVGVSSDWPMPPANGMALDEPTPTTS
ncbi:hypothetical protein AMAG_09466 [Allomyces macrogynus ATCC 38327]|uniref:Uncharacterized protein n=1 Tax=Allomyces macrogynus (strain ATCC 38327) TaxID=578462 RepID=A0A0L0SPX2_ALLM3|nr:hypothetical protein AMAG_09466 [Allomyces macrogynus ATCC 38327]|eukprot:KNE64444.1 hypothetical protein AMAG_09466 [Allomyces macrogynus ATCC 38327]